MSRTNRGLFCALWAYVLLSLLSPQSALAAIESRNILKTYFETGDKPTQAQFADLIDSALNLVDDGLTSYSLSDATGRAPRFDVGMEIGPGLTFRPLSTILGFSDDWLGQSGFLPLAFEQVSQPHYAYLQISTPVPGAPNPYSMTVEYLVFEDLANTPILTAVVPEPSTLTLAIGGAVAVTAFGWRLRRGGRAVRMPCNRAST